MYRKLYIFVEGPYDEIFIERVIKPIISNNLNKIKIIHYSKKPKMFVDNMIRSFEKNDNYIFFGDFDSIGREICITKRKEKIQEEHGKRVENQKIIIIKDEIESWYLAVCNETNVKKYRLKPNSLRNTQETTKEKFDKLIPKRESKIDFMMELIKEPSIELGKERNASFAYFIQKLHKIIA